MSRLPVIVGFGGINPAGRSSGHHAYRRMVIDKLGKQSRDRTYAALAALMYQPDSTAPASRQFMLDHTLVRRLETNLFDADSINLHRKALLKGSSAHPISFVVRSIQLPDDLPASWHIQQLTQQERQQHAGARDLVRVTVADALDVLFNDTRSSQVLAAGQLPTNFNPELLYQSRNHPRGLQLAIYSASDMLNSLGVPWDDVKRRVPGDQISLYASSAMGQLDHNGTGGLLQAGFSGKRITSKSLALGLADMPADFVNAYVLGNVGTTGANVGACASFLYNLRQGVQDIRSGRFRVAVVGASEAPITSDVIEGYRTMGALAEDEALRKIDGLQEGEADHRRACRPFAENCGFTVAEAAQFVVLFDDELALELGVNIHGAVGDVFVNADGFKKSIPGPGIGNYITLGKAMGTVRSILGDASLQRRSYIHAHGTSTPQNRVTESHIFSKLAGSFSVDRWPVTAVKAYVGHSMACASADQLLASLGTWHDGIIPGIVTTHAIADDVHQANLEFLLEHREIGKEEMDSVLINSKGFGGNNATAAILAPHITRRMLTRKHGARALQQHAQRNEAVQENINAYDEAMIAGKNATIYQFGVGVITGEELDISAESISIPGHEKDLSLVMPNPYEDMTD